VRVVAGVDIGSITAKTAIMSDAGGMVSYSIVEAGVVNEKSALESLNQALEKANIHRKDLRFIVTTGYGRQLVGFGNKNITEISCHSRGALFLLPEVRTVIDIGGQDSKVIAVGDNGRVKAFNMNDKCAAGTGRFLEVMARALETTVDKLGPMSLQSKRPALITSQCSVFAESEVISLISQGEDPRKIAFGLHNSIANRIFSMLGRIGIRKNIVFAGGVARNNCMVVLLEKRFGQQLIIPEEPQLVGSIGAALSANGGEQ